MRIFITGVFCFAGLASFLSGCAEEARTGSTPTDNSHICVAYMDVGGGELIPDGNKPLEISINTLYKEMDTNFPMAGRLDFETLPARKFVKGSWDKGKYNYDVGNSWRFEPFTLTPQQAQQRTLITFSDARTIAKKGLQKAGIMMTQTFPICLSKKPLIKRLREIGEWMIKNPSSKTWSGSIFVEGYNQRTILGLYEITGEKRYLDIVKKWANELLATQEPEGYWLTGTGGYSNVYFADTGSALGLLVNYYKYATNKEKERIVKSFDRYAEFILEKSKSVGGPFISDEGWMGIGYQRDPNSGQLSIVWNKPYSISTALTGASVFAAHYYLTGNEKYKQIAIKACDWMLDSMLPNGHIPYIRDDVDANRSSGYIWWHLPYNMPAYCGEGFISAWTFIDDANFRSSLVKRLKPHIEWILNTQNYDGSWGQKMSQTQLRSHGTINLLVWYYYNVEKDPQIARAVQKYCGLILDKKQSKYLEIEEHAIATSLVGRALVDVIKPGTDCRRWK